MCTRFQVGMSFHYSRVKNGTAGSYGKTTLSILKNCQSIFQSSAPLCVPTSNVLLGVILKSNTGVCTWPGTSPYRFGSTVKVMLLERLVHGDVAREIKGQEAGHLLWPESVGVIQFSVDGSSVGLAEKMSGFPKNAMDGGNDSQVAKWCSLETNPEMLAEPFLFDFISQKINFYFQRSRKRNPGIAIMGWRSILWLEQIYWPLTYLRMPSWEFVVLLGFVVCPPWKLRMLFTSLVHGLPARGRKWGVCVHMPDGEQGSLGIWNSKREWEPLTARVFKPRSKTSHNCRI